jgi:L-2-hydroxyglutarate oxidase
MALGRVYDFAVIGGGVIGLAMAAQLSKERSVVVLEKDSVGAHASTRNSGVLHAAIYDTKNSLAAKYCIRGNELLRQFHHEHKLRISEMGKLITPGTDAGLDGLQQLYDQGVYNNAGVELIDYQ